MNRLQAISCMKNKNTNQKRQQQLPTAAKLPTHHPASPLAFHHRAKHGATIDVTEVGELELRCSRDETVGTEVCSELRGQAGQGITV